MKDQKWLEEICLHHANWANFFNFVLKGDCWTHGHSGIWFLNKLVARKPNLYEDVKKVIDINNPKDSWVKIGKLGLAKGIKVAEVAGYNYALLTAFLGGEGTYWVGGNAKTFFSSDKLSDIEYLLEIKYPLDFKDKGQYRGKGCGLSNYNEVFQDDTYDLFMAVNHGWHDNDEEFFKIAEKVLKKKGEENKFDIIHYNDGAWGYKNIGDAFICYENFI